MINRRKVAGYKIGTFLSAHGIRSCRSNKILVIDLYNAVLHSDFIVAVSLEFLFIIFTALFICRMVGGRENFTDEAFRTAAALFFYNTLPDCRTGTGVIGRMGDIVEGQIIRFPFLRLRDLRSSCIVGENIGKKRAGICAAL